MASVRVGGRCHRDDKRETVFFSPSGVARDTKKSLLSPIDAESIPENLFFPFGGVEGKQKPTWFSRAPPRAEEIEGGYHLHKCYAMGEGRRESVLLVII